MRSTQEAIRQYKHICWYPSAGKDFRSLLFLSDWYFRKNDLSLDEGQELPDLFIFTDYLGLSGYYSEEYEKEGFEFLKPGFCLIEKEYYSNSTRITVKSVERLRDTGLPFSREYAAFDKSRAYNSSFLIEVEVESKLDGVVTTYGATVLYVTVLNELFYNFLLRCHVKVEYQVLVRYGEGIGGGAMNGPDWIILSYRELGTKYLITEYRYVEAAENKADKADPMPVLEQFHSVSGKQWSEHDNIGWFRVVNGRE